MKGKWSTRQKRIHEGLSSFGQELAGFYEGGLKIYYCEEFPNGAYFLMHAAREVDGGLRDILGVDFNPDEDEPEKHKKSILFSLGYEELNGIAESWYKISKKFHSHAHRHGAWRTPRSLSKVKPIWDDYESILERLVGSYYSIIERIERIGKSENLKPSLIDSLSNILKISTYCNYFFRHERNINLFLPLKKKGWFSPKQIKFDAQGNAQFWNALDYLENVSENTGTNFIIGKELIKIINEIILFSKIKKIRNMHIWWYCFKILNNLEAQIILKNLSPTDLLTWLFAATDDWGGSDIVIHALGEKLLPKFLSDEFGPDYLHAEAIIDAITEIKPDKKPYPLNDYNKAALLWDSQWVRDAFVKNSKLIGQKCSTDLILKIAGKLKKAIIYTRNKSSNISWINGVVYKFEISRQPDKNDFREIIFIENQYDCVISRYSQEQISDVDIENSYWKLSKVETSDEIENFEITANNIDEMVSELKRHLPKEAIPSINDVVYKDLKAIYNRLFNDLSQIWFRSLANDESTFGKNAEEALSINLRDVLLAKCEFNRAAGKVVLDSFLSDEFPFPIFRRMVLLCTDRFWDDYKNCLEKFFEIVPEAFEGAEYEVELFDLLKNHNQDFNGSIIKKIKAMIEKIPDFYHDEDSRRKDFWQLKWLSPLRDNKEFESFYNEIRKKISDDNIKPYEPKRTLTSGAKWLGHTSSMTKEEILEIQVEEFIKVYQEFPTLNEEDSRTAMWDEKPDKIGLADKFKEALKDIPDKFTDKIFLFINEDKQINQRLFSGLTDACKNKEVDWNEIFKYIPEYLNKNKEQILQERNGIPNKSIEDISFERILGDIAELIAEGCNDDHPFDTKYFEKVEEVFTQLLELVKGEEKPEINRDVISYVLSSTLGRIVMAYVTFALRNVRVTNKKDQDWGMKKYERFFNKGSDGYIWFGYRLPQIRHLDQTYTEEKIKQLTSLSQDNFSWRIFMSGYLEGRQVYKDIYHFMKQNYYKVITNDLFEKDIEEYLVEHICIAYLYSDESLDEKNPDGTESLFNLMLTKAVDLNKKHRWLDAVDFFKNYASSKETAEDDVDIKKRVLEFWNWTSENNEKIRSILEEEYPHFLNKLSKFINLLDDVDENNEKWLKLCAPYIDLAHSAYSFIESLNNFSDANSIIRLGNVFLKILETSTPYHPMGDIYAFVDKLYKVGEKDNADAICNIYGNRGYLDLRSLWEENNRLIK